MAEPYDRKRATEHLKKFGKDLDPREMQARSAAARRAKKDALSRGPRETIAQVLHRRADLLALATEKALEDAASENASLRKEGRAILPRLLDQGLGRIEVRTSGSSTDDPTEGAPLDRETRMRYIAELERQLGTSEDSAQEDPSN